MDRKTILLDDSDFTNHIYKISNNAINNLLTPYNRENNIIKENSALENAFIKGTIFYNFDKNVVQGTFTNTIREGLLKLGAFYQVEKKGYYININRLPYRLQEIINSKKLLAKKQIDFFKKKKEDLNNQSNVLNEQGETFLQKLVHSMNIGIAKKLLLSENKTDINIYNLSNRINNDVKNELSRQYDILIDKLNNKFNTDDLLLKSNKVLQNTITNIISFGVGKTLIREQVKILKEEYKTTKFRWIHRSPPQPQDRKIHIKWWKSREIFDFDNLPFNYEIGDYDYPRKLIHCHCKIEAIINDLNYKKVA